MSWWNKGATDKAHGQGQADPNKFENDADRKSYQSGWNKQKEQEQRQEQQQRQQNKK